MSPAREPSRPPALAELLAQAGWMRALARSLVGDPDAAEDVVQDAWVIALAKRATVRADLASWLRTVVRNLALRRLGREGARPGREREALERAGSASAAGDVGAAIERMELQRWLAGALLALDEPYRSAVILRHVEALDAAEIAARQGCSPEAARQRVARGLAQLRRRLDAERGGRETWGLVLAPWLARDPLPLALPTLTGGLLMGSKTVLGSLAALAAVVLAWLALERGETDSPRGAGVIPPASAPAALAADERAAERTPTPLPAAREALSRSSKPPAPPAEPAPAANPLLATLSGRVLAPDLAPIPGAEVVVRRPAVGHLTSLELEPSHAPREVARAATDAAGRFAFELERGIPFDVAVSAPERCERLLPARYAGEQLEVVLSAGFLVHGSVRRERDRGPIADARVVVFQMNRAGGRRATTTTRADGSFSLRIDFQEDATLEVTPLVEQGSAWIPLAFDPEGVARQDVLLADGLEVRGRVVEAGTGRPIAGALVGEGWTFRRSAASDARGEYVLPGFGATGVQELYAKAAGHGTAQRAQLPAAVDGVIRVDFELPRGRVARGRVLDGDGRPLAGAYVAAVASDDGPEGQRTDWISGRTDAGGRFELGGLRPKVRHALLATAEGFDTKVYDFPAEELDEAELELGDVRLAAPAVLAGAVQDERGEPLAGVEVRLTGANRDRARLRRDAALPPAGDWYVGSRHATTDARGRFWLGALPPGDFALLARERGRPESPRIAVSLAEGELRDGLVLVYPGGEELAGAVVDAEGRGVAGVYVNARLTSPREPLRSDEARSFVTATVQTGADGGFALRGLRAGGYHLDFHPFGVEGDPDSPWLSVSLDLDAAAVESEEPLRVVLPRGALIRGRLLDASGAALVGYVVVANRPPGAGEGEYTCPSSSTAEDGAFALGVPYGTVWDLEVRGAWQTAAWDTLFHEEPSVAAGTRGLELRIDVEHAGAGSAAPR